MQLSFYHGYRTKPKIYEVCNKYVQKLLVLDFTQLVVVRC